MTPRSRQTLTRETVLEAAIDVADHEGISAVTMRRVGLALGVEAMSLYNHVKNKQDILTGMATLLLERMAPIRPRPGEQWQDVLHDMCWSYRQLITAHPNVFMTQTGQPQLADATQPALSRITTVLLEAGFKEDVALDLFLVGSSYTRGFALSEIAYAFQDTPPTPDWNPDRAFERGITAILTGFTPPSLITQGPCDGPDQIANNS